MPAYMGSYRDVQHFADVHIQADEPNPCHMTMDYSEEDWNKKFQEGKMGKQCIGQAIFYKNQCKSPRRQGIPTDVEADKQITYSSGLPSLWSITRKNNECNY